jgi:opacity protein-like surface antigen
MPVNSIQEENMKRKSILILSLAAILLTNASLALADSNYFVVKGGLYAPSSTHNVNTVNFDSKDGFVAEAAFGHYFLPVLAVELGAGYFESKASPAVPAGEMKLKVVPVTLTAKAGLPLGILEPYAEAGVGAYITKLNVSAAGGNLSSDTKGAFGVHVGGGVNFNLLPNFFVGAEGKYLWAKQSFGGQDIRLDGFFATADVGIRY